MSPTVQGTPRPEQPAAQMDRCQSRAPGAGQGSRDHQMQKEISLQVGTPGERDRARRNHKTRVLGRVNPKGTAFAPEEAGK